VPAGAIAELLSAWNSRYEVISSGGPAPAALAPATASHAFHASHTATAAGGVAATVTMPAVRLDDAAMAAT
jgi:hypothetical protein